MNGSKGCFTFKLLSKSLGLSFGDVSVFRLGFDKPSKDAKKSSLFKSSKLLFLFNKTLSVGGNKSGFSCLVEYVAEFIKSQLVDSEVLVLVKSNKILLSGSGECRLSLEANIANGSTSSVKFLLGLNGALASSGNVG